MIRIILGVLLGLVTADVGEYMSPPLRKSLIAACVVTAFLCFTEERRDNR